MREVLDLVRERDTSAYVVSGVRWPSVTEVLALAGLVDFRGVPVRLLEEAAARGQIVHAEIARRLVDGPVQEFVPVEAAPYLESFERFVEATGFKTYNVEHVVRNARHRYAGRVDALGTINGHDVVIDWKCAASIAPWVALQLAGYQLALGEHFRSPAHRYALRLQPERYVLHRFAPTTDAADAADFLACVRIAHWQLTKGGWSL